MGILGCHVAGMEMLTPTAPTLLHAHKKPGHDNGCRSSHPGIPAPPSGQDPEDPDPKQATVLEQAMPMVATALPLRKKIPKTAAC